MIFFSSSPLSHLLVSKHITDSTNTANLQYNSPLSTFKLFYKTILLSKSTTTPFSLSASSLSFILKKSSLSPEIKLLTTNNTSGFSFLKITKKVQTSLFDSFSNPLSSYTILYLNSTQIYRLYIFHQSSNSQ
jgi:hypothetical protein